LERTASTFAFSKHMDIRAMIQQGRWTDIMKIMVHEVL
jgi:hypothetical protein